MRISTIRKLQFFNHQWVQLTLLILLIGVMASPVLLYPMGRDQGMYANIGNSILQGGAPFIDMWDIKPPPIYYIYALGISLFGDTPIGIRAIDFLFIPLGMIAIYLLGTNLSNRRVGLLSVLIFGTFYFNEQFASLTQNDSLITVPIAWAMWFAYKASSSEVESRDAIRWSWAVGLLAGFIVWFKQYNAFFILVLIIHQIIVRRGWTWARFPKRESLAFLVGGFMTGGAMLIYFASIGIIQEMIYVAEGTSAYNAQGYDFNAFINTMGHFLYFRWLHWGTMLILIGLWLPTRWLGATRKKGWRIVWLTIVAGLAFAFIQAKGFDTHWMPMLPALALLAGDSADRILQFISRQNLFRNQRWVVVGLYGLLGLLFLGIIANSTWRRALPYVTGEIDQVAFYDQFQANDLKPEQSLQVIHYLSERIEHGDSLFIWGFRPEVYFMGGYRPATRYQAHFPLVAWWYPDEWKQNNVDILWAAMPPYVLVLENDYMPWVTDSNLDSHQLLQDYEHLNNWLIANYDREHEIGDFLIWRRKA